MRWAIPVGKVPIVPPTAAAANAISHGVGVCMTELPMSPVKVLEAQKKEHAGA